MRILGRSSGICCALAALGCTVATGLFAVAARADQPEFPYTAYVCIDNAYVRSGPGKHYYPTDKLKRGNAVEVYRQAPGGWLAIRPPRKSFSWVPASSLQPTQGRLGVLIGDRVASHIGSRLNDSLSAVQVWLERGEQVEILAAEPLSVNGEQSLWCKIAPPSGEFRWIYGKFVDRSRPAPSVPFVALEPLAPAPPPPVETSALAPDAATLPAYSGPIASDSFDAHLTAVDLALSATVVQQMSTWRFDDLERRAERVLNQAQTADQRERARRLLDRVAKFEDIKRRSDAIAGIEVFNRSDMGASRSRLQLTAMTTAPTAPILPQPAPSMVTPAGSTAPHYDAVGKLTSVRSLRPNAPPYALLDANREPIAFVTPGAGVDLRPLLGHQIGVSGTRGYMPEFKRPHITAMLAEPLDGSDVIMALRDQMRR